MIIMPTIDIDLIGNEPNSFILSVEFIAHRLNLIPLTNDDRDDKCGFCSIEFFLNVWCDSDPTLDVISVDLQSTNPRVCPVNVDITRLAPTLCRSMPMAKSHPRKEIFLLVMPRSTVCINRTLDNWLPQSSQITCVTLTFYYSSYFASSISLKQDI